MRDTITDMFAKIVLLRIKSEQFPMINTIFEGTKLSLSTWFLAEYLMKLGLSNKQIADELDIEENTK